MLFSQPSFAENRTLPAEAGLIKVETVAKGLQNPWGLTFLPDGQMLVTERPGRLRLVSKDGAISKPLTGVPEVFAQGHGGLLDVAIDPDFKSKLLYLSYAEPGEGGASTAVARGKLGESGLDDVEVIFRQVPKINGNLGLAPGVCPVHHAWRALPIHAGPGLIQSPRQNRAHQS